MVVVVVVVVVGVPKNNFPAVPKELESYVTMPISIVIIIIKQCYSIWQITWEEWDYKPSFRTLYSWNWL